MFLVKIPLVLGTTTTTSAATASFTPPAEIAAAATGFSPKVTADKAALMVRLSPGRPPVQVTPVVKVPPVVHPEPEEELCLPVVVEGAGDEAVVASGETQDLRHLGQAAGQEGELILSPYFSRIDEACGFLNNVNAIIDKLWI